MKFTANVVTGRGRGRSLGFPTFNVTIPHHFDFKYGVYAARVWIDNIEYTAACHFGPVPSFDETEPTLEFYVLDYTANTQITKLAFAMLDFIRPILKFDDSAQLAQQIAHDVSNIRKI